MPKRTDPHYYRRNLPHMQPVHGCFFVTTLLHGALPKTRLKQIVDHRPEMALRSLSAREKKMLQASFGKYDRFVQYLPLLSDPDHGPFWLAKPEIADLVADTLLFLNGKDCRIIAFTIMPNHVHVILDQAQRVLFRIMQSFKRYAAKQANMLLQRPGNPFWQEEYFDYLIRNDGDLLRKIHYVLQNPVEAGFVAHWKAWKYSYLHPDFEDYGPE